MPRCPSIESIRALDGKIYAMLKDEEKVILNFYMQQGRKYGVSVAILNKDIPDALKDAKSKADAEAILLSTNSRVYVTVSDSGFLRIENERRRQVESEGYSIDHDDEHDVGEFVSAAACYASCQDGDGEMPRRWPWSASAWKPKGRLRNLERAGALYMAAEQRAMRADEDASIHRMAVEVMANEINQLIKGI